MLLKNLSRSSLIEVFYRKARTCTVVLFSMDLQAVSNSWFCKLKLTSRGISRYITLFVVSGSIKKLFLHWLCQYLPFLNIFFNRFCPVENLWVSPHSLYLPSLTLRFTSCIYFGFELTKKKKQMRATSTNIVQMSFWLNNCSLI